MAIVGCCRSGVTAIRNYIVEAPRAARLGAVANTLANAETSGCDAKRPLKWMLDLVGFRWLDSKLPSDGLDPTIIVVPPTP
jgi:hypothetical protein